MASDFTLRQARYFLMAVETGTMAAAARALHVSPSAVSLAVSNLEEVLDATLLVRTPHRPLALTPVGAAIVGDLRRLVTAADDLVTNAHSEAKTAAGRLRLGCFRTLAPTYVPRLVAATSQAHPAIELEVDELSLEELQDALLDGQLELALLYDLDIRAEVATEILALTRPSVLLGGEHRLAGRSTVSLTELADEPMIMLDVPPSRHYFETILTERGIEPRVSRTTGSLETLRSLVARNQGWSMLIQRPVIDVSYEGLPIHTVEITEPLDPMPVIAAWPAGSRLTRRAELFLDLSRTIIGNLATDRTDAGPE